MIELRVVPARRRFAAGPLYKEMIQAVRRSRASQTEAIDLDAMHRPLVLRPRLAAHQKAARRNDDYFGYLDRGRHYFNGLRGVRNLMRAHDAL